MASFEELKKKAKDALGTIADVSAEAYKVAEEKAKTLAKSTKISTDIAREKSLIKRLYAEIGEEYYKAHKDAPEGALAQNCEEVTAAFERIAEKQKELEDLKNSGEECCCDCECETVPEDDVDIEVEITTEDNSDANPDDYYG